MSANGRHNADAALLAALATGLTFAEAARSAGVSERTARRRMEDDNFRSQLSDARAALVDRVVGRASDAAAEAVESLRLLMRSAESETARISAARTLLQFVRQRGPDPIADALQRAGSITIHDFQNVLGKVMDAAIDRIPEERRDEFLLAVRQIGMR